MMSEASQAADQGQSPDTPVSVVIVNYEGREHLTHTLPAVDALEGVVTEVIGALSSRESCVLGSR